MLANSRTDSEMMRTNWEITSITKIGTRIAGECLSGSPEVGDEALGADALDLVEHEDGEREYQRIERLAVAA